MQSPKHYLFYLHGKIVEDQGPNAVEIINGYGAYEYNNILHAFSSAGFNVLSEVRQKNTDVIEYSHKIVEQVNTLISNGTEPQNITVIGASKGAIIAMLISSYLKNKDVNFVFLAGCNADVLAPLTMIQFCGNILSIYEKSDDFGGSCGVFKAVSQLSIPHYKEIELNTGLRHGFIFKPLREWVEPSIKWAKGNYE